jgi:hypothetical protein
MGSTPWLSLRMRSLLRSGAGLLSARATSAQAAFAFATSRTPRTSSTLTIPTNSALVLPSAPRAAKQVRSIRPTITYPVNDPGFADPGKPGSDPDYIPSLAAMDCPGNLKPAIGANLIAPEVLEPVRRQRRVDGSPRIRL